MAEFKEVAAQKKRMCNMYDNNGCNGCPLNNGDCGVLNMRFTDVDTVQHVETTVMSWAAEHPEPVYPTWIEWFRQIGLVPRDQKGFHLWLHDHIPADIAEKLGLQPKEGA